MAITNKTLSLITQMGLVVDDHVDAVTGALTARWSQVWHEISDEWVNAATAIQAMGAEATPAQILRLNQVTRALQVTADKLEELSDEVAQMIADPLERVVSYTAEVTGDVVASQMPVSMSFTRASDQAMSAIVARTMGNITSSLAPLAADSIVAMKASLLRGIAAGWHPDRAAREMVKRSRTAFNGGLSRAMTIARTEMLDAHRAVQTANDTVIGWKWFAHLDAHVCPSCAAMHGEQFDTDVPGPEDHPNGRCARIPVTKTWKNLGFDIEEPPDEWETVWDWMERAPHEAVSALGPERVMMLNDGTISRKDMATYRENPEWRGSYQATPLSDLRKKAEA